MVAMEKPTPDTPETAGANTLVEGGNNDAATGESGTETAGPDLEPEPLEHQPSEITYDEQFYAARPRALRPRARLRKQGAPTARERVGEPVGTNPAYVDWLVGESMLQDAKT